MWQKNTLSTVLNALLLAQFQYAAADVTSSAQETQDLIPVSTTTEKTSSEYAEQTYLRRSEQVSETLTTEFHKVTDFALQAGKALAERLLDDPALTAEDNKNIQLMRRNLTQFVREVDHIAQIASTAALYRTSGLKSNALAMFLQLVQQHNTTILMQPTAEDFLLESALQRHGWTQFKKDLRARLHYFVERIEESFRDYLKAATEQEKRDDKKMIDWFGQFEKVDMDSKLDFLSPYLSISVPE